MREMMLALNFKLLSLCGCWPPISSSSSCKKVMYNLYTALIVFLVYSFTFSQFAINFTANSVDDFIENSYLLLTLFICCSKLINLLLYRDDIVAFIGILSSKPCVTLNTEETEIQTKYDKVVRVNTIQYMIVVATADLGTILNSLLVDLKNGKLPYRAWMPYNYDSPILFCFTYIYQLLGLVSGSFLQIASDALFCGILSQICCQIDILAVRLANMHSNDTDYLRQIVLHHDCIYRLAAMVNDTFKLMILAQFVLSTLVLCVSLAQLLKNDIFSTNFMSLILYLSALLTQIFLYCWYGNEVKLKSLEISDAIFRADWMKLSREAKKMLLIVMKRAEYPIEFNSAYIATMNLQSFMALIKTSYSAYSILQTTQE